MILKFLLIIAVIGIVYFIFIKKKPTKESTEIKSKNKEKLQSNDMVACSTCGTYSEVSETIISANKYYCSNECVENA